jgi:hypothetical protein
MSTQVQWRRGNASENNTFTGANAEITVDTTNWTLRVHDGVTAGGYQLVSNAASQTLLNKTLNSAILNGNTTISGNLIPSANLAFNLGSSDFRFKDLWLSGNTIYMSSAKIEANATALIFTSPLGGQFVFDSDLNLDLDSTDANIGTLFLGNLSTNANIGTLFLGNLSTNANIGQFYSYANTKIGTNPNSNLVVLSTVDSISSTTGALVVQGGVGVTANVYTDKLYTSNGIYWAGNNASFSAPPGGVTGDIQFNDGQLFGAANIKFDKTNGNLVITSSTNSVSTQTGALVVAGGVGIGGPMFVSNVTAGGITSNGTVQAATLTGTLSTASQPNITTLAGLTSFGTAFGDTITQGNLTVVGNLTVQGNTITIGSNNLTVQDSIIDLHTFANLDPLISDDGRDIGIRFHYYKGAESHAFFGWENSVETLVYLQKSNQTDSNITGTFGNVQFGSLLLSNTTAATSTTTGALQVKGGAGVAGNVYLDKLYTTNGLYWAGNGAAIVSAVLGFLNSTLFTFPTGDYGDFTATKDAFGVHIDTVYDLMEPIGSYLTVDLDA